MLDIHSGEMDEMVMQNGDPQMGMPLVTHLFPELFQCAAQLIQLWLGTFFESGSIVLSRRRAFSAISVDPCATWN